MILADKYEVLDRVGGAAIIVQRARNVATGQTVFVHRLVAGSQPATEALKLALRFAIQQPSSRALLDVLDDTSGTYIVTEDKPEYISLMDWLPWALSGNASDDAAKPPAVMARPEASPKQPGDFTQKFNALKQPPSPPSDATFPPVQRPASNPPKLPLSKSEPGEFTRFFKPDPAAPKGEPAPVPPPKPEAGEFTRMFSNPLSQPAPVADLPAQPPLPSSNPRSSHQPGEFTRMFGSGGPARPASPATTEDLLGERIAPPPPSTSVDPGEFTRIIKGPGSAPVAASSEPPPASPPPTAPAPAVSVPKPPIPAAPALPKPPAIKVPAVAPPAAAVPSLPKKNNSAVLILIIAVVVAALAVVLVFALRH